MSTAEARFPYRGVKTPDLAWLSQRQCAGTDTNLFFPDGLTSDLSDHSAHSLKYKDMRYAMEVAAKKVCAACPVRSECLEDALIIKDAWGIRGGTNARERRRILKKRGEHLSVYNINTITTEIGGDEVYDK